MGQQMKQVSVGLDMISEASSVELYLSNSTANGVTTKAIGGEINTDVNIFKGNFYISGKVMAGGSVAVKIENEFGTAVGGLATFFIDGSIGLKDGCLVVKGRVVVVEISAKEKVGGVIISQSALAGLGGGVELGSVKVGVTAAGGYGASLKASADLQELLED